MSGTLGRRGFSCGPPLLLFGVMPLVVEGLSEQRALGCFRFHANLVASRVFLERKGPF